MWQEASQEMVSKASVFFYFFRKKKSYEEVFWQDKIYSRVDVLSVITKSKIVIYSLDVTVKSQNNLEKSTFYNC